MNKKHKRLLVIVDLENIAQGSSNVAKESKRIRKLVDKQTRNYQESLIVVSTGRLISVVSPQVLWDWKDARFIIGNGIDGADKELLEVLENEPIARSTESIQIWSGDHCFAPITQKLKKLGCQVDVFSNQGSLAHALSKVASNVRILPSQFIRQSDIPTESDVQYV